MNVSDKNPLTLLTGYGKANTAQKNLFPTYRFPYNLPLENEAQPIYETESWKTDWFFSF